MTAQTPGQAAHRAYWVTLLRGEEPTDAYDDEEAEYQRAWDASAQAVAGPLEAEIKRLRGTLAEIIRLTDATVGNPEIADFDDAGRLLTAINTEARRGLGQQS